MGKVHTEILRKHLAKRVLESMMDPGAPAWLYEQKLANLVTKGLANLVYEQKQPQGTIQHTTTPEGTVPQEGKPNMFANLKEMFQRQTKNRE